MKKCVFCETDFRKEEIDFCSIECARMDKFSKRLKRIEDVLVEIKYEIRH